MSWLYQQATGWVLNPDGTLLGRGYSGADAGKDNPDWQGVADVGPLPQGIYRMGDPVTHPVLGECAIPLKPDIANRMWGREDFWIHGDKMGVAPGHASEGCIVLALQYREKMVTSGDRGLEVVSGRNDKAISA